MAKYIYAKDILNKYSLSYSRLNHYTDMGLLPMAGAAGINGYMRKRSSAKGYF